MATFYETARVCIIYILFNQIADQYAYNLDHAQVRRKIPQNRAHLNPRQHPNHVHDAQINHPDHNPRAIQHKNDHPPQHDPSNILTNQKHQADLYNNPLIINLHPQNDPVYQEGRQFHPHQFQIHHKSDQLSNLAKFNIHLPKPDQFGHPREFNDQPQRVGKTDGFRMQRGGGFTGSRQTFKHFRYSRIRRYYTLSTATTTTWIPLNYTTRLMYTTPTTRTTYRYTDPYIRAGPSRQTVLHTRMTESDEIGRDRFMSGSIEYKDDSFDKPPTAMVAYDSLQADSTRNTTRTGTAILSSVSTVTKPITKSTKKISSELISLESSSEEKSSSSEAKDVESSSESEDYGTDKFYGEYGYHRKFNATPNPYTIITYANIREVPGFSQENLTSAEVAFWEANASYVMEKYFPSAELPLISNYSEENLVRSFFHNENIGPHHLDFYKWYYKLLTDPERLRTIYNRTVLEEPDYKNLSQFTPFAVPDDLQRYYMFICQMENEINRERQQEERTINTQREAEQNLDRILGVGGGRPAPPKIPRFTKKKGDLDVSQILQMVDGAPSEDSMMPGGVDSSEGFIDTSRYKREVSKFEPD